MELPHAGEEPAVFQRSVECGRWKAVGGMRSVERLSTRLITEPTVHAENTGYALIVFGISDKVSKVFQQLASFGYG